MHVRVSLCTLQHYDLLSDRVAALGLIDEGIQHTPTACDLYMFKARILKHMGRLHEAADVMNFARTLDLADRYINSWVPPFPRTSPLPHTALGQ